MSLAVIPRSPPTPSSRPQSWTSYKISPPLTPPLSLRHLSIPLSKELRPSPPPSHRPLVAGSIQRRLLRQGARPTLRQIIPLQLLRDMGGTRMLWGSVDLPPPLVQQLSNTRRYTCTIRGPEEWSPNRVPPRPRPPWCPPFPIQLLPAPTLGYTTWNSCA